MNSRLEWSVEAPSFRSDIYTLSMRVQRVIAGGAAKRGAAANSETVVSLLNEALAIEMAFGMRFEPQYFFAYAERIAARILELGSSPNYYPDVLLARAEYLVDDSPKQMIQEDLSTERLAMSAYREILEYMKDDDLTTRGTLEAVLARHGEHIGNLVTLLQILDAREPPPLAFPSSAGARRRIAAQRSYLKDPEPAAGRPEFGPLAADAAEVQIYC